MEYQPALSVTAAFSKKLSSGGSLSGKHVYDGVFGGAMKSGTTRMEDYKEIFGASSNCSIPILDFPEMNISGDVRSSKPDYSTIFGGFGEADFAVSYEELVSKPKKVNNLSKEARTPAEASFCPTTARTQHSNISKGRQAPSPEVCPQLFDGVKQFNVSNNKSNQGSKNRSNGMAHIAQHHSIPGDTCLINETTPSLMTENVKPARTVLNDTHLNKNVTERMKPPKLLRKVVSGPQPGGAAVNTSTSHAESKRKSNRNKSFSNDISFDAFEIGLGTVPSTVSPLSSVPKLVHNKGGSMRSMNSKFGVSKSDASVDAAFSCSPPPSDEEIDANSAAASSVAALRRAIEEAEAKMKIAKELMEKKRQGLHNRAKSSLNDSLKAEKREIKAAETANRSKEETLEMDHKIYTVPKQVFTGLSENNATKASQTTPDLRNAMKPSIVKNATEETQSTESKWAQVNHRLGAESGKATNGFSEPAGTSEHGATEMEVKQAPNVEKMIPCTNENEFKEKMLGDENMKNRMECGKKLKPFEEAPIQEKVERVLNSVAAAFKWDIFRNIIKSDEVIHHQENEDKTTVAYEHEEAGQTLEMPHEQEQYEVIAKRLNEPEEEAKSETQEMEEDKDMNELKEAEDWLQVEKEETESRDQEEPESRSNEVPLRKDNERRLHEIDTHKGNGKRQVENLDSVKFEEKQERWDPKENEKNSEPEHTEILDQFHKQEVIEASFNHFEEDSGTKENESLVDAKYNDKMLNQINENEVEQTYEGVEAERTQIEIHLRADNNSNMELTEETFKYQDNLEAIDDVHKLDKNENAGKVNEAYGSENFEDVQVTSMVEFEENDRMMEVIGDYFLKETGNGSKASEKAYELVEEGNLETGIPKQDVDELDGIKKQAADVYLGETDWNFDHKLNKYHMAEYMKVCEQEKHVEEVTFEWVEQEKHVEEVTSELDEQEKHVEEVTFEWVEQEKHVEEVTSELDEQEKHVEEVNSELDKNEKDVSTSEIGLNDEENDCSFSYSLEEKWLGAGIESKTSCDPEKQVEETIAELGENKKEIKKPEVAINHDEIYFEFSSEEKEVSNRIGGQATQQPFVFEREIENIRVSPEERKNQSIYEKEEGHHETLTVEKKDSEDTAEKETELEKKNHERKEENKVREMEKEKERIAVERAIREARERAFAEARERAERAAAEKAAAEAHQRVIAEAREGLEKACAEANGKSAAEKASLEAKLKAERAAVERATAEARERALERALSEKAAFNARNPAEKFSGVPRDAGLKSSEQQYKGSAPTSSSKYPSSSNHDERSNGESVERCKATIERNQRTAERAAKALAEKNMRDLLAQKEQAERNRLAEILDADVKRWSSGKERNLRALLSTLHYILSPDSGWQPIPLTDLISTAAVKKAYRKATLFVHPDKLQQRGASIQQKYTCEKVFDLLKDAWNKFSAEER
ncbi:auxilin-like protein 1 isoform X1 [Ricinus communis]|uniref:auxilin-like protein 1 isoform X1 n=1 Tax=Ricinus communis TaxID=3988 RepID=UPI00201B29FE|nr:auxilin-like protein 1 isoform X1 [Ricinus communis]